MSTKTKKDLQIPFTWDGRRPVLLERFFYLPKQFDHKEMRLTFSGLKIFGNEKPVHMEICSGNGQWICERAAQNRDINFVAVELRFDRARNIWLKSFRMGLSNLYIACADAKALLRYYVSPGSIERSFVNFPDPWPKRSHGKHRILWAPFIEDLSKATKKEGSVTLLTDHEAYRDQIIEEFGKVNSFSSEFTSPFYKPQMDLYGDSFFADLWREKGKQFYYMSYRK
jgi:tRNA (guanine-N7-)-methyltransferase